MVPLTCAVLLQIPSIQTKVCKKVVSTVSEKINGEISLGNIYYALFDKIIIEDIAVADYAGDTLLSCGKLSLTFSPLSFFGKEYRIRTLSLQDGAFAVRTVEEGVTNISLIFNKTEEVNAASDSVKTSFPTIYLNSLKIRNFSFSTENRFAPKPKRPDALHAIIWSNMNIDNINLSMRKLRYKGEVISADLQSLSFNESKGLNLNDLSMKVLYDTSGVAIKDLNFDDGYSNVKADYLFLKFNKPFEKFTDDVVFNGKFNDALLDFRTLQSFTAGIDDLRLQLRFSGIVKGPVSDLISNSFLITSGSRKTSIELKFHLLGLPVSTQTMASMDILECHTNTRDLAEIIQQVSPGKIDKSGIYNLASGVQFNFKGSLNGFFEDFVAFGEVTSSIGDVNVDIMCRNERKIAYEILGHMRGNKFDIGRFLGNDLFGKLSCTATISATMAKEKDKSELFIDNIGISEFRFNGYDYSNITATGSLANSEFDGRVVCSDPNLKFMFHGLLTLSNKNNSLYKFNLSVGYANLAALNFDKRKVSELQVLVDADFTKTVKSDLFGKLDIKSFSCRNEKQNYDIGNIHINSVFSEERYTVDINSSLFDAKYLGTSPFSTLISDMKSIVMKDKLENLNRSAEPVKSYSGNSYSLDLMTHDMRPLCEFVIPGLYIGDSTSITVRANEGGKAKASVQSSLLAYNNNFIRDLDLNASNADNLLRAMITTGSIQSGNMHAQNDTLKAEAKDNSVALYMSYKNGVDNFNSGHVNALVSFPNRKESNYRILVNIANSLFVLNGEEWDFKPSSIYIGEKLYTLNNFGLVNGEQSLSIDGTVSENETDSVKVRMNKMNLSLLNPFVGEKMALGGTLTGNADAVSVLSQFNMFADIKGDSISIAGGQIGKIALMSNWDEDKKRINILLKNELNGDNPLRAMASYTPSDKSISGIINIDKLSLSLLEPMISFLFYDISGSVSGDVSISGTLSEPSLSGSNCRFNNFAGTLDFTKVPYIIDGPFEVMTDRIRFKDVSISDKYGHIGKINGGVNYDYLKDFNLDIFIRVRDMLALNTDAGDNDSFYGRAFATGGIRVSGPTNNILLDINATTGQNTTIHIPLSSSTKEQTSLLTFTDREKPKLNAYDSLVIKNRAIEKGSKSGSFTTKIKINATTDAEIQLEINKAMGDVLKSRGTGLIDMTAGKDNFDIRGNYNITEGNYKFVLLGLVSRDFILNPGGTINFNGDIMQSDLNLTATYRTKASISPLIASSSSSSSVSSTRRTVDCGIGINGKLANPKLNFTIDVPDLNPTIQGKVESALNTEDKMMKQFLTLLLSGSFIPDEQSGIVNNTTVSLFNASEIMSNQLNSVFRQLDIPLDLGLNYQPGESGRDIFDVAVSTQLFNNRVIINGNIGNRQYESSAKSDVVGDVDVEIKIDKSGRLRLTLFSHSADEYSNYLDQTQRNGAGITYQEEFDTFGELCRKIFWKKSRREEYERTLRQQQRPQRQRSTEKRTTEGSTEQK